MRLTLQIANPTGYISRFLCTLGDAFAHFVHPLTLLHILGAAALICLGNFASALVPFNLYLELPRYVLSPIFLFAYLLALALLAGKTLIIATARHDTPLPAEALHTYRIGTALILLAGIFITTALHQFYKYDDPETHILITQIGSAVILTLLPLCTLAYLQHPTLASLYNPQALLRAWKNIGWWRYPLTIAPGILLNLYLSRYLGFRYVPQSITVFTPDILLSLAGVNLIILAAWLFAILYPICCYPAIDTPDDSSDAHNGNDNHDTPTAQGFAARLHQAEAYIRAGDTVSACTLLAPYTDTRHDPATYHPAYRLLYAIAPSDELRTRLINAAISGSSDSYDIIAADLARLDPAQLPAGNILPLVRQAFIRRDYASVLNLTRHFAKAHPTHPHLVENYHFAARSLAKTGHPDKALTLLGQLHTRYPAHPQAAAIARTLRELQQQTQQT